MRPPDPIPRGPAAFSPQPSGPARALRQAAGPPARLVSFRVGPRALLCRVWSLALVLALACPADAAPRPDALAAHAQPAWDAYQLANLPRAFAIAPSGTFAWRSDPDETEATVRQAALDACQVIAAGPCGLLTEGLVREPGSLPAPATPLAAGPGWTVEADPRFHWRGPNAAEGAILWTHGTGPPGNTYTGQQPPAWTRSFNLAGWDVLRFDRFPELLQGTFDGDARIARRRAAGDAAFRATTTVREAGYRRVVVAGFSAGAWILLHALEHPGLADAAILVSAASHGPRPGERRERQIAELEALGDAVRNPGLRLAIVQFEDDPFLEQPARRASIFRDRFAPRLGGLLLIDRPAGFLAHGAEDQPDFAPRFGPCLLAFTTAPAPFDTCP